MASAQISTTIRPAYIWTGSEWVQIGDGGSSAAEAGSSISVSASAPASAVEGSAWFDNTDGKFYVYDGTFWVESAPTDAAYSSYNRWTKVLSGSASIITGLDENGMTLDYTPSQESLYINGIFIDRDSYTATSGSSIILDEISFSGDVIEIVWLDNIAIADIANIYLKTEQDNLFLTQVSASNTYLTQNSASATYLTINNASSTYTTLTQFNNIDLTSTINTASAAAYASASTYTNQQIASLVDSAPETLNTLNEIAEALNDNADVLDLFLTQSSASSTYLTITNASAAYEPNIPYVSGSPSTPAAGTLWIDSTNNLKPALKVYNGSEWIAVSGAASESGFHPFFGAY
jgi:hypothetical protein